MSRGETKVASHSFMRSRIPAKIVLVVVLAFLLTACGGSSIVSNDSHSQEEAPITRGITPEPDSEVAVIETEYGSPIVIELYSNIAPRHVERFKQLIRENFYDGTTFHRIDPSLGIIQGGDPNSRNPAATNLGTGNSSYPDLPAEFSDLQYERGSVGAARSAAVNSANSQFYITLKRQPAFDQRYTVFGRAIQGLNTASIISTAPLAEGAQDRPAERIVVRRITLQPRANFTGGSPGAGASPAR